MAVLGLLLSDLVGKLGERGVMLKKSTFTGILASLILISNIVLPSAVKAQTIPTTSIPATVTQLFVSNGTSQAVTVYVTLQAHSAYTEDGCTSSISDLEMINMTPDQSHTASSLTGSGLQGTFSMPSMSTYELVNTLSNPYAPGSPQPQDCLQGIEVTFNQPPQCPNGVNGSVPNGVNGGEPTLNLPGTINGAGGGNAGANESCDITCVNGANSIIQITVTSPSANALPWVYNVSQQIGLSQSLSSQNSWVSLAGTADDNCNPPIPGVFPFGCTQCNRFPDPGPPCGQFCSAENGLPPNNGCVFSRSPNTGLAVTQQFGGSIQYTYLGPSHPPANTANTNAFREAKYSQKKAWYAAWLASKAWKAAAHPHNVGIPHPHNTAVQPHPHNTNAQPHPHNIE